MGVNEAWQTFKNSKRIELLYVKEFSLNTFEGLEITNLDIYGNDYVVCIVCGEKTYTISKKEKLKLWRFPVEFVTKCEINKEIFFPLLDEFVEFYKESTGKVGARE
jgi:hypothetical protein